MSSTNNSPEKLAPHDRRIKRPTKLAVGLVMAGLMSCSYETNENNKTAGNTQTSTTIEFNSTQAEVVLSPYEKLTKEAWSFASKLENLIETKQQINQTAMVEPLGVYKVTKRNDPEAKQLNLTRPIVIASDDFTQLVYIGFSQDDTTGDVIPHVFDTKAYNILDIAPGDARGPYTDRYRTVPLSTRRDSLVADLASVMGLDRIAGGMIPVADVS